MSQADVRKLVAARLEAAHGMLEARRQDFEEGRGTLDILLEVAIQTLRSELDVLSDGSDPVAPHIQHWALVRRIEAISKERYDKARIPIQEYAQTKSHRLEAEIWLLQAQDQSRRKKASALARGNPRLPLTVELLSPKELARAWLEFERSDLRSLHQARLESARLEHKARAEDFLAGRGTLDILFGSCQRLLEEELAVSPRKADQLTALEKHWERALVIEWVNEGRFNAGRISYKEYMEPKYLRLAAEIQLIQARVKDKAKGE